MKKKIDKVLQDRFHNLEISPPPESWEVIAAALPKKKKRRVILLWYEMAGVAAVLTLVITLYNSFFTIKTGDDIPGVTFETKGSPYNYNWDFYDVQDALLDSIQTLNLSKPAIKIITTELTNISQSGDIENKDRNLAKTQITANNHSQHTSITNKEPGSIELNNKENIIEEQVGTPTVAVTKESTETDTGVDLVEYLNNQKDRDKDIPLVENTSSKRLSVRTTAGAVYFDNFGKGNSLDPQYSTNSTSGDFTMVYGVNLAYKLSPNLSIRTGVNKVQLSHNTNNIDFEVALLSESLNPNEIITPLLTTPGSSNGHLNQTLEYIEIPLEVEFAVLDKKVGINFIGGVSTFFLDSNMISHHTSMSKTELGEANNLNSLSYSANFGLGFNYNFSPEFQFNLEPIFKYQLNTYTNGEGLNPYIFGIYSGFTFKF